MLAQILGPDGIIIVVALLAVLLLGGRKISSLARSLGSAQNEFKKGAAASNEGNVIAVVTALTTPEDLAHGVAPVITHVDVPHQVD
jgi:hypothetical protein